MTEETRKLIDNAVPRLLAQASAVISVNRMVSVSGKRHNIILNGDYAAADGSSSDIWDKDRSRSLEIVYYSAASEHAPLICGFHSGGFLFGGAALNDTMWKQIAEELDINIASIGYRKAPKFKWRQSLTDAFDSICYLKEHADEFGFDQDDISLLGASAGGTLAASCALLSSALKVSDEKILKGLDKEHIRSLKPLEINKMILLYPLLDMHTEPALKGPEWYGGISSYIMNEQHTSAQESMLALVSPSFAEGNVFEGLPDTICFTAEYDALKHEGNAFAEKIKRAGGNVYYKEIPGVSHCYFELGFRDRLLPFESEFIGPSGVKAFNEGRIREAALDTLRYLKEHK